MKTENTCPSPAEQGAIAEARFVPGPPNAFRRIGALGYRSLLPIVPPGASLNPNSTLARRQAKGRDARGKSPGMLRPDGWGGCDWLRLQALAADMDEWSTWGAGVGLRLGDDRVAAVDFDLVDGKLCKIAFTRFCEILPHEHKPRIGRAPKFLVLVKVDGDAPIRYRRVDFADGQRVELLGHGRQCVVDGVHPVTGNTYDWPGGMPHIGEVLVVAPSRMAALFDALAALPQATSKVLEERAATNGTPRDQELLRGPSLEVVRAAVAALPNTTELFPTRDLYLKVGYAIKASLPDHPAEAFDLYDAWCSRWEDPPPGAIDPTETADDDWSRMYPPYTVGFGWLAHHAEKHGGWRRDPAEFFKPIAEQPDLWKSAPAEAGAHVVRERFELVDFVDAANSALEDAGQPLISDFLECGSFCVLYGPSGVGKTFLALDLAFHVAMGLPWNALSVRRMRVVYVAAEGAKGARRRADAIRRRWGISDDDLRGWFHYRMAAVDLLRPNADLQPMIDAIQEIPDAGLVIVDTMSRALGGGDENSPVDMGSYVKNIDRLRATTSACVLNVHHTGKDVGRGARGHSLLRAATDTEIEISPGELAVSKQREFDSSFRIGFVLEPVVLGHGADGRKITSCVVRYEAPAQASKATEKESLVLAGLRAELAARPTERGAKPEQIVGQLTILGTEMSAETARSHLKNLLKKSLVENEFRGFWRPKTGISELASSAFEEMPEEFSGPQTGRQSEGGIFE